MGGIRRVALILAGLLLAAPASAGTGSELRGVIQRTEQLRGLGTTRPLAVSTVDAKGMRRVVLRELARERQPRDDAAWNDALHLLGVLTRTQSLDRIRRERADRTGRRPLRSAHPPALRARLRRLCAALGDRARGHARAAGRALPDLAGALRAARARPRRRAGGAGADRGRCDERAVALRRRALARGARERARAHARLDPVRRGRRAGSLSPARARLSLRGGRRVRARPARSGAGSACWTGPSATHRGRRRRYSTRRATWRAILPPGRSPCPPATTTSRRHSGPRTWRRSRARTGSREGGWADASGSAHSASSCAWRRAAPRRSPPRSRTPCRRRRRWLIMGNSCAFASHAQTLQEARSRADRKRRGAVARGP